MNDIDFIKKSTPFAEGFEIDLRFGKDVLVMPDSEFYYLDRIKNSKTWGDMDYFLFLTRTIEGINREFNKSMKYRIRIDEIGVRVLDGWGEDVRHWGTSPNIDNSKRYAIEYVLEQLNE